MTNTTRHTTAASLHAAILRASLLCQTETRNQWEGLQGTRYAACKQFDAARAEAMAQATPAADTTPAAEATPAADTTPAAQSAPWGIRSALINAALVFERCTNILCYDAARREAIEAGRAGKIEAMAQATAAQAIDAAKTTAAAEGMAESATLESVASNTHHVSAAGQKSVQNHPGALETAEEVAEELAEVCATEATACADGAPGAHTTLMGHATTPGAPGTPRATMGHTSATAGQASHSSHSSAQSLARADGQRIAGKSGRWSAVFYTTPGGLVAMTYTGPTGQPLALEFVTGSERMRALQTLARQADTPAASPGQPTEPASQPEPTEATEPATGQPGAATGTHTPPPGATQASQPALVCAAQVPDYSDPLKTSAPDYSDPLKTLGGALQITLTRAEGLIDECGTPHTLASFAEADALLRTWSETAPEHGGYDKCDFSIVWPDGNTYAGRYDLKHHRAERPSLTRHMVDLADFYNGHGCPDHMSAAAYANFLEGANPDTRAAYEQVARYLNAQGVHTGRARPVSVDLRELVAAGLPVAGLVGLGVTYCGDALTASKVGAIVAAEATEGNAYTRATRTPAHLVGVPHIEVTIHTEDGASLHAWHDDFSGRNGDRYRISTTRHGAPYLAQLAAAVATRNAQATSAKEAKAKAHADELARLAVEFAHLERANGKGGGVFAARNIRTQLKRAFPGVKFSVKSDYNSVGVRWTDGPTDAQVCEVVARFDIGAADTQADYFYTVSTAFSELFGGVQYLTTRRDTSDEFTAQALAEWWPTRSESASQPAPTAQDWRSAEGVFGWRTGCDHLRACFRAHLGNKPGPMPTKATRTTRKA